MVRSKLESVFSYYYIINSSSVAIQSYEKYQIYSLHILQQTDIYPENYVNLARIHDVCCIYTKIAEDRDIVMADVMRICEKQISKDIF